MQASSRSLSLLITATVVLTIANMIGTALLPTLLTHHPLVLLALSPIDRHMVLAASVTQLVPFVTVTALRRTFSCALGYGFGQHYGDEGVRWIEARYPRFGRFTQSALRVVKRASPVLILLAPWHLWSGVLAGFAKVNFVWFLVLALIGQVIFARLAYQLSAALSTWIAPIVKFFATHMLEATLITVTLVAIYAWRRRRQLALPSLPEPTVPPVAPPETPRET